METTLNLPSSTAAVTAMSQVMPRAITTVVLQVEGTDQSATLPSNKPFVAQVVNARLSGAEYPENPAEIVPPDRTLRPYDVPMLPYDRDNAGPEQTAVTDTASTRMTDAERTSDKD